MDWRELNQIDIRDLKNLDYGEILQKIRRRPDVLINLLLVMGSLIFCLRYYAKSQAETRTAKVDIPQLEKKIKNIKGHESLKKELDYFLTHIPPSIEGEKFINQVTDFAVKRNIQIESFTPAKERDEPLYELSSFTMSVSAKDYRDIWLFIHDIETSPQCIHIVSFSGYMDLALQGGRGGMRRTSTKMDPQKSRIKADLEIASIKFKTND